MRKPWTLIGISVLMAALTVAAIGCSSDNKKDTGAGATATEVVSETPRATQSATGTPAPGAEIAPITMNEVNGSGVTGSATITETGVNVAVASPGHTQVVVTIDGGLEPGSHLSHIHHGNCSNPTGEIHVNLTNVEAGADGAGIALTSDPVPAAGGEPPPFSHWLAREHYVAVHALNGDVVSCGDVVAETPSEGATAIATENATLGTILTDSAGRTLYKFANDQPNVSNCNDACAQAWPALTVASGTPTAGTGVSGALGTFDRADGTTQVTYDGSPLYRYGGDAAAGDTNGNGLLGKWSVITLGD
jgi:predicted lipoprotein with Yx(FWY)xxD motif